MRPHKPDEAGPKDIDESTDTYDTIDWLLKNVPNHNGKVGMWGISYPGFYTAAGMIDAHPALKAVSPQAPVTDWFVGDDFHHNGALFLPHAFNFIASFGQPRPEPTTKVADRVRPRHARRLRASSSRWARSRTPDTKYFKGEVAFWNEVMAHGTYDDVLEGPQPAAAPEEHQAGGADRRRLVRRREPVRRARDLPVGREAEPGRRQHARHGPVGPRRLGARRRRPARATCASTPRPRAFYREQIELPFFEHHLKGKGDAGAARRRGCSRPARNHWRTLDAWPPHGAAGEDALLPRRAAGCSFEPPTDDGRRRSTSTSATRRKPVPFIDKTCDRHGRAST